MGLDTILIVEDEAVVALDLKMQLSDLGYHVVGIADTAARALDMAERHQPALTLMDVMLKGETDGIDAARVLHERWRLPVLFLTSFSDDATVQRAARTAPYGYLTKPFQIRELRASIEVALSKSRLERQLRESERWFALTLRCVHDGVLVVDAGQRLRFMNPAAEHLTGWSLDEAAGQPLDAIVQFDDAGTAVAVATVGQALREARVVGVCHGRHLVSCDGRRCAVDESAGPVHDESGVLLGAVLVLRDAGSRLRQEARLRASEQRFRAAFDAAPLGMGLVALDGRFLQVNAALCRLLECEPDWLLGRSQAAVTHPDDVAHEADRLHVLQARAAAVDGAPSVLQFEKRYLRGASRRPGAAEDAPPVVTVLVSVSPLGLDGEPSDDERGNAAACYLYQVNDLTAQHQAAARLAALAEEQIRREASELASRSKSEFLSRASHEMRTPLNAVLGFAQLLQMQAGRGDPPGEPTTGYAQHIVTAGKHLLGLVDDMLDIGRADSDTLHWTPATVAMAQSIGEAVVLLQPLAASGQIVLSADADAALMARVDPLRLRQILLNLGGNAIKYNRPGGSVRISAAPLGDDRLQVVVEDDGLGWSADEAARLFQPFDRLGREASGVPGVGLGLVISRKLSLAMGGTLQLSSRGIGQGTTATLTLPRARE